MRRISTVAASLALALGCAGVANAANRYPTVFTNSFVKSCVKSGGTRSACECTLHYIEARMAYTTFLNQAIKYEKGGKLPPIEKKAVAACI